MQSIARAAAALFQPSDTLMIGTGPTAQAFVAALAPSQKLTVITNSISVAIELHRGASSNRVYVTGGEYRGEAGAMFGSAAVDHIGQFRAEHAVLTIGAVDIADGLMDFDVEEATVARAMIAQAEHVTRLVTDRAPSPAIEEALQRNGVHGVIAS